MILVRDPLRDILGQGGQADGVPTEAYLSDDGAGTGALFYVAQRMCCCFAGFVKFLTGPVIGG